MVENINKNIRCLRAPNPSPMTSSGTNTYLVGQKEIAVIDPGPINIAHLDAIFRAVGPTSLITKILITHSHIDHSPLARLLSEKNRRSYFCFWR
jgi:glyoxylase-like metal-dependent hydrolase (beta-lactamase superfamily II)